MKKYRTLLWLPALLTCFLILALSALAPQVVVRNQMGEALYSFPLFSGDSFEMEYLHSVQLCPVIDRYYATKSELCLWEERTQSTNAGLPTEAPFRGRFVHDGPWYCYLGGGRTFKDIFLRVGNDSLGLNTLTLPSGRKVSLFELFPGKLLTLGVY